MSGYRCVNYYELCRLCAASHGTKVHIFSEEGKKRSLFRKIAETLQITVEEKDKLPKIVCVQCLQNVETISDFRDTCSKAQSMLLSCLNSTKLKNDGQVYIKDVPVKKSTMQTVQVPPAPVPITVQKSPTVIKPIITGNSTTNPDFLSSIIQAVGIHANDESNETIMPDNTPQYTITLDGQSFKNNQYHYKIEEPTTSYITAEQQQSVLSQVDEFLKVKAPVKNSVTTIATPTVVVAAAKKKPIPKPKKQPQGKINLVLTSPTTPKTTLPQKPQQQQQQKFVQQQKTTTVTLPVSGANIQSPTSTISPVKMPQVQLQDLKIIPGSNNCVVPIVLKNDGSAENGTSHQILTQLSENKPYPQVAYLQMKIQSTGDGQTPIVHLTPTSMPTTISLTPQNLQQYNIQHIPTSQTQTNKTQQIQIQNHMQPQQQHNLNSISNLITSSTPITILDSSVPITTFANSNMIKYSTEPQHDDSDELDDAIFLSDSESPPPLAPTRPTITTSATYPPTKHGSTTIKKVIVNTAATKTAAPAIVAKPKPLTPSEKADKEANSNLQNTQSEMATQQLSAISSLSVIKDQSKDENSPNSQNTPSTSSVSCTTCEVCKKEFKRKEHLMQHLKSHVGLRPFKCDEVGCNKCFSRKEHLMRHIVSHTGKKMFSCDLCHKLFSRKDNLNKHKRTHTESSPSYQCSVCSRTFTVKVQYLKHKASHNKNENPIIEVIVNKNDIKTPTKTQIHQVKKLKLDKEEITPKTKSGPPPLQKQTQHKQQPTSQAQQPQIMQVQLLPTSNTQTITLNHQSATSQQSKTTYIKTADGSTVYTIPSNLIINQSHFMTTGELMGNFKIENQ